MKTLYLFAFSALLVVSFAKPLMNGGHNCDGGDEGEPPLSTSHIVGKAHRHGSGRMQAEHVGKAIFCGGGDEGEGEPPRHLQTEHMVASVRSHGAGTVLAVPMQTEHKRAEVVRVSAAVFCDGDDNGELIARH